MKLTAIVGVIDMNGYLGREPHPEPSMRNGAFPVVSTHTENLGVTLDAPEPETIITVQVPTSFFTEMDGDARVVVGPDGRRFLHVELLPHEISTLLVNYSDAPEVVLSEKR